MLAAQRASDPALPMDVRLKEALDAYELLYHERARYTRGVERRHELARASQKWWREHVAATHPGELPSDTAPLIDAEGAPRYDAICDCDGIYRLARSIQSYIEWWESDDQDI